MKIQNSVGVLLLVIASQTIYAVDNRIVNMADKPVQLTIIYKNNKQDVKILEPNPAKTKKGAQLFLQTTKANPIQKIFIHFIGTPGLWLAPIGYATYNQKIDLNEILIYHSIQQGVYVSLISQMITGAGAYIEIENKWIDTQEIPENV